MQEVSLRLTSVAMNEVTVQVRNDLATDIILLSPRAPSRELDRGGCRIRISTKVDKNIRPFAFTPELLTVRSGQKATFRVRLDPVMLAVSCSSWTVIADYAYLRPDDVAPFQGRVSQEFWEHAVAHQQVVSSESTVSPATP
jgi:hypothetical protein